MQATIDTTLGLETARVVRELAGVVRHCDALEDAEVAGHAAAGLQWDQLAERRAALVRLLSLMQPTSPGDALAMAAVAVGHINRLLDNEVDDALAVLHRVRDLLVSGLRHLANGITATDDGSLTPILKRYAGIG